MKSNTALRTIFLCACVLALQGPTNTVADAQPSGPCVKADAELNGIYKKIRRMYKNNPKFLNKLKVAQRAWLKFRDAHMEARYPLDEQFPVRGAEEHDCLCYELANLTNERSKQLKEWLKGTEEGDVCAGSLRLTSPE